MLDIQIVTDSLEEAPPSSDDDALPSPDDDIEIDEDARPTNPGARASEPKVVRAPLAPLPAVVPVAPLPAVVPAVFGPLAPAAPPVPVATAAPVALAAPPIAPAPIAPTPVTPTPIAPTPPRVAPAPVLQPAVDPKQPAVDIKDLPPMRALAPTEPEGLEVQFEDEEPISSARSSEPEAEIAAEDLVSVESVPSPSEVEPLRAHVPVAQFSTIGAGPAAAGALSAARASVPPPPSIAKPPGAQKGAPRVIVPSASALAPPPMSESAPTGRRKARPWWEELFNDDFIRTMAKISDAQIAKEVDYIEESLAVAKGAMLLDLGCGTGRHAIELTRRGYKVVGFDLSLPMLAKAAEEAQDRGQKLNFVQGDMREMTFEDTFDGIYCWNTSFGFFEEDKNNQVVQRVHKALKKGGQFVLEVGNRDFIIRQAPSLAWFEGDGCICMDEMSIDWITSRMKVKRTMMMDDGRTKEIDYSVRIYSLHELGKILHDAGFRVAEVSGRTGTPGVFFGNESPRTMILAEKK
jgi:SAM-dependent methyltransferase